ncbi:MAG: type IX secretion system sortase PorU [Candidatus Latescibacterota bacterium]
MLTSNEEGVRLLYVPGTLERTPVRTSAGEMDRLRIAGAQPAGREGWPAVPLQRVVVGIPLNAQVEVRVVALSSSVQEGYRVAPAPRLEAAGMDGERFAVQRYVMDAAAYGQDQFWPEAPVTLGEPSFLRDQRVVEVVFNPVRFHPLRGEILRYDRMEVEVVFRNLGEAQALRDLRAAIQNREGEEVFYRGTVLNYEDARAWRRAGRVEKAAATPAFGSGIWVKVTVVEDGMVRVTGAQLLQAGVALGGVDPKTIRMFYGGGQILPRSVGTVRRDQMEEMAILVEDGGDGHFDESDTVLFYGSSVHGWTYDPFGEEFEYHLNPYTHENCYWLTFGDDVDGKRMEERNGYPADLDPIVPETFRARLHQEVERFNVEEDSGIEWFWDTYQLDASLGFSKKYSSLIYDASDAEPTKIRMRVLSNSGKPVPLRITFNNETVGMVYAAGTLPIETAYPGQPVQGVNVLGIHQTESDNRQLLFDWYEIEYSKRFVGRKEALYFTWMDTSGMPGIVLKARIEGFGEAQPEIFDVSDPFDVRRISGFSYDSESGEVVFQDPVPSAVMKSYYVAAPSRYRSPHRLAVDSPSDLKGISGADYVIITHADFYVQARSLARWREEDTRFDGPLQTVVVKVQDVYDEFSWGLFDPTAIRDFLKYTFEQWTPVPRMVLLFGDGVFDYKNNQGTSPGNWIPPYEEIEATTDDWFVRMDASLFPDMAIGRLPVQRVEEAETVVRKIIEYEQNPLRGDWQNTVLIAGDDERQAGGQGNQIEYTVDSEDIAQHFIPKTLDQVKVFLMEYEMNSFLKKPKAKSDLIAAINRGALLFNYVGHGNYDVMAHEDLLRASTDIPQLKNGRKLPLAFSASCSNGHFDHPIKVSLAERLLTAPDGGVVAMIAGTRLTTNASNVNLNSLFYANLFSEEGGTERIGLALMRAKVQSYHIRNTTLYNLMGDPAMRVAMPERMVHLTVEDTLRALDEWNVEGSVDRADASADFEGQVFVRVWDSANEVVHVSHEGSLVRYQLPGAPLFRGIFPVNGGEFAGVVRVPKGITYGGALGRVSAFVWNEGADGAGAVGSLRLAGTRTTSVTDEVGPVCTLGFRGQDFSDGDFVESSPVLLATIQDESGINVTGEIGHDLEIRIDGAGGKVHKVTEYFVADGTYEKGNLEVQLGELGEGTHTIALKAWDNSNNSSLTQVTVEVASEAGLSLKDLLCFPNPMRTETTFTYQVSREAEVTIRLYTLSGRLIETIPGEGQRGYNQVLWGSDVKLANGVYLYKITARDAEGRQAEKVERLAVVR